MNIYLSCTVIIETVSVFGQEFRPTNFFQNRGQIVWIPNVKTDKKLLYIHFFSGHLSLIRNNSGDKQSNLE